MSDADKEDQVAQSRDRDTKPKRQTSETSRQRGAIAVAIVIGLLPSAACGDRQQLKHFQRQACPGLDTGVVTGSRQEKRVTSRIYEASPQTGQARGSCGSDRRIHNELW